MSAKLIFFCIFSFGSTYFGTSAASADFFKPSVKDQIGLGKRAMEQIEKQEKLLPESDVRVIYVRKLGEQIVATIDKNEAKKKPFEYKFNVIDNKEVNAFALPGGPIYIYTGLLDKMTTGDQLLGVLSHEVIHVLKEHWASAYAESQKRRLGLAVILTVLNAGDTAFNAAAVSDTLLFELPYSRRNEQQADDLGYETMAKLGFNPTGMVDTFEILKKESGGKGGKGNEWVSDHPALDRRIEKVKNRLKKEKRTFPVQKQMIFGS